MESPWCFQRSPDLSAGEEHLPAGDSRPRPDDDENDPLGAQRCALAA